MAKGKAKATPQEPPKVTVESVKPKPEREATHYVVLATQALASGRGEYVGQGEIVPAADFGDSAWLHLARGAIRAATFEESQAYIEAAPATEAEAADDELI